MEHRGAPGDARAARHDWVVGAAILCVAAAVRLYGIGREPLWLDEGYSWWDARQSLENLWRLVPQCDPHPPLYALLLKGWGAVFGESAAALRALGAALSVAATGMVMFAGRELGRRVGWIAGALFAVAPFQIEYSHEARPYALVALGAAAVMFGALRIVRSVHTPLAARGPGWIAIVLGGAIMLWANNTSVFFLAALGIAGVAMFALDRPTRSLLAPALAAAAFIAVLWLPYLPVYLEQARGISADFWIPKPDAWRVANELRFVIGLGDFLTLWMLLGLWGAGIFVLWRRGMRREAAVLAVMAALPVALNLAVSLTIKPIYLARALIGIAPAFSLALAVALASLNGRALRVASVAALAAARLMVAVGLYVDENRKEPWDEIADYLLQEVRRDALVLLVPNELALPLGHALEEENAKLSLRGVPADFPAPGIVRARYPSGKCTPSVVDQDLSPVARMARTHREVVVITRRNNVYDPRDRTPALLRSLGMTEEAKREFRPGYIVVHRFVAPGTTVAGWP
jgi:mannosyltransferase